MECYAKTPRTRLLELLCGASNIDELYGMSEEELRMTYCEMMAGAFEQQVKSRGHTHESEDMV
jgi:hypothetical protein